MVSDDHLIIRLSPTRDLVLGQVEVQFGISVFLFLIDRIGNGGVLGIEVTELGLGIFVMIEDWRRKTEDGRPETEVYMRF